MIYLTEQDLSLESYQRFILETTADDETLKEKAELSAIALAKTFLNRYNISAVFDQDEPLRDEHLANLLSIITVYKLITRNAARKVSSDLKEEYQWAMKQLEKIQQGSVLLALPPAETIVSESLGGNNTNKNFYI